MRHVGADEPRVGERAGEAAGVVPGAVADDALEQVFQPRALGAALAGGADLLVVEQREDRGGGGQIGVPGGDEGLQAGVAGGEVVEARGVEELGVEPGDDGGGEVVEGEVPRQQIGLGDARGLGEEGAEGLGRRSGGARVGEGEERGELLLGVELQTLVVDASVHVDGEGRDPAERTPQIDEDGLLAGAVADEHAAGEPEVAVGPSGEHHAAVGLDAEADVALVAQVRARLDAEVGRVGVGGGEAEAGGGRVVCADAEGHDRAAAEHVALGPGGQGLGGAALVERGVTGGFEQAGRDVGRVEGRGGGVEEGAETVEEGHAGSGRRGALLARGGRRRDGPAASGCPVARSPSR